jgi:undecaprenyl diphosphate synthase
MKTTKKQEVPEKRAPLDMEGKAPGKEELLAGIDPAKLPEHVAIIMDGNRRWARQRKLPVLMGHRQGVETFRMVLETCLELGIRNLSVYAFSQENWKRSAREIDLLMSLFRYFTRRERQNLRKRGVRFLPIGDISELPQTLRTELLKTEEFTADCTRLSLNLCVNYSARSEILRAARELAREALDGTIKPGDITEEIFSRHLLTGRTPDPDLLIRTSGESRLSNFFLWQCAYTEFWFTGILWPDFGKNDFLRAILEFQHRERRYGGTSA